MSETDSISRQQAIDALWKALYAYEDKTEKQFQESDELDVSDWILHREFVQNMSDIDRQVIRDLPSVQPDITYCKDCVFGYLYFDVHNRTDIDSWVECRNPDGLNRDVSTEGYCSAAVRRNNN